MANYNEMPDSYVLYGTLFALCNRIQTMGDGEFEDITMKQHFLLVCLSVFEAPPSLKELSNRMGCSYQNVKRMALALQKNGYISLNQDEYDHRRLNICITEKVKELSNERADATQKFMELLYKGISSENIAVTRQTLEQMWSNIKEVE